MLDLDRFKHVNDVLGYRIGDLLLVAVGRATERSQVVRDGDVVARLGGDEFARAAARRRRRARARRSRERIERVVRRAAACSRSTPVDIGAGIGIACWPQHADDGDALLSRAEVAMYAAKRRGNGAAGVRPVDRRSPARRR